MFGKWKEHFTTGYEQLQDNFSSFNDTLAAFSLDRLHDEESQINDTQAKQGKVEQLEDFHQEENTRNFRSLTSASNGKRNTQEQNRIKTTRNEINGRGGKLEQQNLKYEERQYSSEKEANDVYRIDQKSNHRSISKGQGIEMESNLSCNPNHIKDMNGINMYHRNSRAIDSLLISNESDYKQVHRIENSDVGNSERKKVKIDNKINDGYRTEEKKKALPFLISTGPPQRTTIVISKDQQNIDISKNSSQYLFNCQHDDIDPEPESKHSSRFSEDEEEGDDISNYWTFNLIDRTKNVLLDNVRSISESFPYSQINFSTRTKGSALTKETKRKERQRPYPRYQKRYSGGEKKESDIQRDNEIQDGQLAEEGLTIMSSNISYQDSSCVTKTLDDIFTPEEQEELLKFKQLSSRNKAPIPIMKVPGHPKKGMFSSLVYFLSYLTCSLFKLVRSICNYLSKCPLRDAFSSLARILNQRLPTPEKKLNVILIAMLLIVSYGLYRKYG